MLRIISISIDGCVSALVCLLLAGAAFAQEEMPASPVRYTEAREHAIQRTVRLPGSVESKTVSLVATEVAGLVDALPAREGDVVRRGKMLARLRSTSLKLSLQASQAQLKEAESRLKLAELKLTRNLELFDEKVLSQQELDDARYEHDAWRSRIDQVDSEIEQIEYYINRSVIRAPFTGVIVSERTEVGEWLDIGSPVVEMVSLDVLEIRVEVPERYFSQITLGARTTVKFESIPGYSATGKVSAIVPRADPLARTFPIKVRLENQDGRVGVGMLAQVAIPAGESYPATVVPKDAIVRQGSEEVLYLLNGDNSVERVAVVTGAGVGSWVAVSGPVAAGQKVITRGNERLMPGQSVSGEPLEYALP